MKLVIIGATGGSGLSLVRQALEEGHEVIAAVRNPAKLSDIQHERFQVVVADVYSAESLQPHFVGCDAIMSCLGVYSLIHTITIYSQPMKAIVTAMRGAKVKRIVIITSWYIKVDPDDDPGRLARWVVRPILRKPIQDAVIMEQYLENECQDIDYTTVRPPRLTNSPSQGKDLIIEVGRQFAEASSKISRADVARFMLSCLKTEDYNKKFVSIGIKA